jgi:protocatechuate 3,4-dioxygenase beta subunit
MLASPEARAAVPAALVRSAVAAATAGMASITATNLSTTIIGSMAMTKLKIAAAGVLAVAALASVGVLAVGSWRPDPPRAAMIPQAGAEKKPPQAAKEAQPPASGERIEVRGRVVDPQGRPVAGAAVRTYDPYRDVPYWADRHVPEATSGPDGRFMFRVRPRGINSLLRQPGAMYPWVVASAPGFGPGWASAVREPGAPDETTVRLEEDGPPIEGRIVDLEGRPVAGARVEAGTLWFAREGSVSAWLDRARDAVLEGPWRGLDQLPASIIATTGPDGRFRLTGIGRDRLAEVFVSGPTIATAQLYIANRDGAAIRTADPFDNMFRRPGITYYPRRFEYAAGPTRPIEGTIRDKDTGRPIAGLTLRGMVYQRGSLIWTPGIDAKTDARGHYRLNGLPGGPSYRLFIEPGRGHPYSRATLVTPAGSPALELIAFDIALKRGVLVRGRVTDKATGRPVSGYVHAFAFADNPHADQFPGYRENQETYVRIGEDGRYEIAALPGRGLIACLSDVGRYRWGVGAATIQGYDPKFRGGGFHTLQGGCRIDNYHVLAEIHPDPKAETVTLDLQVDPGRSLIIHAVDPEGRPLVGTKASGLAELSSAWAYEQDSPAIEVHALDPSKPRRVTLRHDGRKLVGSVYLKGDEAGPLTVRLQPSGAVTGRIVDEEGRPRGGLELNNLDGFAPEPPPDRGFLPGCDSYPWIQVGRDGRFRVEGLIPGLKYGAGASRGLVHLGEVFRDVTVGPGEVKDLGDLRVVPERDN